MLLECALTVERLGADVADHDGIAHEAGEALEVRVIPGLEAQASRLDHAAHAELGRTSCHGRSIGVSAAGLYGRFESIPSRYEVATCAVSASIGTISSARSCVAPSTTGATTPAR